MLQREHPSRRGPDGTMTRNWGRWGSEDERGAINLLTPERVRSAATAVERGEVIALAQPFSASSPASSGRSGLLHHMVRDGGDYAAGARVLGRSRFAEDFVGFSTHLGTHIDSLSHLWYDEELYNGHPQNSVRSGGARRCGVEKLGPVVGRGLLLDVAAHLGLEVLPGGTVIDAAMLRACCAGARVELEPAGRGCCCAQGGMPTPALATSTGSLASVWMARSG